MMLYLTQFKKNDTAMYKSPLFAQYRIISSRGAKAWKRLARVTTLGGWFQNKQVRERRTCQPRAMLDYRKTFSRVVAWNMIFG